MGFEKPWGTDWKIPVSDTQAYRQMDNAVFVPVVEAVARLMHSYIADAMVLDDREVSEAMQAQLPLAERGVYAASEMPAEHLEMREAARAGA